MALSRLPDDLSMERPRYIAVEGPIGVGKTTLAQILAEQLGARLVLEQADENPFLPAFYSDRKKHAFQAQLFFLLSRYQQQQALVQQDLFSSSTVSDYLFAKDRIFAALTLEPAELALYEQVYELLGPRVVRPDLVVYLQARTDVLVSRVRKRGPRVRARDGRRLPRARCRRPTTTSSSTTRTRRCSWSTPATSTSRGAPRTSRRSSP